MENNGSEGFKTVKAINKISFLFYYSAQYFSASYFENFGNKKNSDSNIKIDNSGGEGMGSFKAAFSNFWVAAVITPGKGIKNKNEIKYLCEYLKFLF